MSASFHIETITETWQFGSYSFEIERIRNLDELVDQVSDEQFRVDERLPYWAELWPSALALSRYIVNHQEHVRDKSVLELGCGIGLTSLCLAVSEPSDLVLTDYENDALEATWNNFLRNGIRPPEIRLLDWRKPDPEHRYERIVASDILYERRFFDSLMALFEQMLEQNGYIILAEPGRPVAQNFFEIARERGYFFSFEQEEVVQGGRTIKVQICFMKK